MTEQDTWGPRGLKNWDPKWLPKHDVDWDRPAEAHRRIAERAASWWLDVAIPEAKTHGRPETPLSRGQLRSFRAHLVWEIMGKLKHGPVIIKTDVEPDAVLLKALTAAGAPEERKEAKALGLPSPATMLVDPDGTIQITVNEPLAPAEET